MQFYLCCVTLSTTADRPSIQPTKRPLNDSQQVSPIPHQTVDEEVQDPAPRWSAGVHVLFCASAALILFQLFVCSARSLLQPLRPRPRRVNLLSLQLRTGERESGTDQPSLTPLAPFCASAALCIDDQLAALFSPNRCCSNRPKTRSVYPQPDTRQTGSCRHCHEARGALPGPRSRPSKADRLKVRHWRLDGHIHPHWPRSRGHTERFFNCKKGLHTQNSRSSMMGPSIMYDSWCARSKGIRLLSISKDKMLSSGSTDLLPVSDASSNPLLLWPP